MGEEGAARSVGSSVFGSRYTLSGRVLAILKA